MDESSVEWREEGGGVCVGQEMDPLQKHPSPAPSPQHARAQIMDPGFKVQGLGFRKWIQGLGFRI